jgi:putative glutamine amidotransferase
LKILKMDRRPVILVAPSTAAQGEEFSDASISLSNRYTDAIIAAGGLPQVFPATTDRSIISEAVERCDGVLLTGGEDVDPKLYATNLPEELAKKIGVLEPQRDQWEAGIIEDVFQKQKPLLAICRGHQMLNVALGGTLVVDIGLQIPSALDHRQMNRKCDQVHDIEVAPDSLLAKAVGTGKIGVNSTHHQAIGKVAEPLRVVAQSSDGVIEAVELKARGVTPFLMSVQFHPERLIDTDPIFLQLFTSFVTACQKRPH